jgi:cytochrome c biogenesis protein CcmG/thiol:disulfide interchange protein DsbE
MRTLIIVALMAITALTLSAQETTEASTLPNVKVKSMDGAVVETGTIGQTDQPVVLSFWATWCKPCMVELQTYHELLDEWKEELGVDIYAVSIDDSRNARKVPAFVKGRTWAFNVLLDENQDFKRAMNVNNVPHTFIVQNGKVVWSHSAFAAGDEEDIEAELRKLLKTDG